eukprot:5456683-Prymnesium_polylepis.3
MPNDTPVRPQCLTRDASAAGEPSDAPRSQCVITARQKARMWTVWRVGRPALGRRQLLYARRARRYLRREGGRHSVAWQEDGGACGSVSRGRRSHFGLVGRLDAVRLAQRLAGRVERGDVDRGSVVAGHGVKDVPDHGGKKTARARPGLSSR